METSQLPKMLKKLHLYTLLLCALISFGSYAQTYPISISTQLSQPSPIYLSNYADATTINSPIKIQLVLNDLTISNRQVRLKIYFQGNGISFSTNDFVVGSRPLYLEGGFPLQLTNVDLAPYFEYQNLSGLNPNQYAQPLPEGIYNIYVEVYDFATGKKLSNKTGSTTIIFQNDPPFLNLPLHNASIMQQNIQNIIFSWTPRSINVSNVEYEFSLVEIWDKYTPIQNAFAYSPPLYTATTRTTTLQYGINEPQLIPGKKYAWRIKAKAILGAEEIGVFKNNGYSEIFSFDYEIFCTAPLAIKTSGVSENQAKIEWSGNIDNYDYQVNYREKNANSEWYKQVTPRENITLSNLKPNTNYEYTVGSSCDVGKYTHSTVKEFTTIARDEIAFASCGIKPDPNDLTNTTPLPELFPNDVVSAGDFPIVVIKATGSNGTFSGEGYVTFPFLEKFRKLIDATDNLQGIANKGAEIVGKVSTAANASANLASNAADKVSSRLDNPTANSISNSTENAQGKVADIGAKVNEKAGDIAADIGKYETNIGEYTRVRITFNNIGINTDFKLISGEIIASYDPEWKGIADLDPLLNPIIDKIGNLFDKIYDLLKRKEEGSITKIEFDKEWFPLMNQAQQEYKEILNDDIPEEFREKVKNFGPILNEVASTTFESAVPNAREKVTQFENIKKEYQELLALDEEILKKLAVSVQSIGKEIFIKCTTCKSSTLKVSSPIDNNQRFVQIKQKTKQYLCIIASIKETNEFEYIAFDQNKQPNTGNKDFLLFYQGIKSVFSLKDENILALINTQQQVTRCKVIYPFDAKFCEDGIITNAILKNITDELQQCYNNELESIAKSLVSFTNDSRTNQGLEFAYNGKIYQLNSKQQLEEIKNPLTDNDIREGKWTDASIEVKIRFTKNKDGIFQYQAVGIKNTVPISNEVAFSNIDPAKLKKDLALHVESKGNLFFQKYKVTTANLSPAKAGINLNNNDKDFADRKEINLDNNASFAKISFESLGLLNTFLQTATIEEPVYLVSSEDKVVIHAPGLVTGTLESATTVVTDVTSLCAMVYDLSTDEKTRRETWTGLVKLRDVVEDQPSGVIPIFVQILSGNTNDEWAELAKDQTDEGKKGHIYTRGVVTSVKSVFAGGAIITKLPKLADDLVNKIDDLVKVGNKIFKSADEFAMSLYKKRSDIRDAIIDLTDSKNLALEYFEHIKKTDLTLKNIKFDDWFENTFKKYESGTPNFEAHHVIPADLLVKNEELKELLFELHKADPNFKFDFNGGDNGIMLQKKSKTFENNGHTSHKQYNDAVSEKITNIINNAPSKEKAFERIQKFINDSKEKLKKEVLLGDKDVNDIVNF